MNQKQKQELGFTYYVEQGLNAKETAAKCGVTEKTVGKWVALFNWKDIRTAKETAPNNLLKNYYDLLNKLVEKRLELICEVTDDENDSKKKYKALTDEISKIAKAIENLKRDGKPSLRMHLYCVERFTDSLMPFFDKYNIKSELTSFTKQYINNLAKES